MNAMNATNATNATNRKIPLGFRPETIYRVVQGVTDSAANRLAAGGKHFLPTTGRAHNPEVVGSNLPPLFLPWYRTAW